MVVAGMGTPLVLQAVEETRAIVATSDAKVIGRIINSFVWVRRARTAEKLGILPLRQDADGGGAAFGGYEYLLVRQGDGLSSAATIASQLAIKSFESCCSVTRMIRSLHLNTYL